MACIIHTPIGGSFGRSFNWYIDPTFLDVIVQEQENGLSSTVWQPT